MRNFIFIIFLVALGCHSANSDRQASTSVQGKWNNTLLIRGKPSVFIATFRPDGTYMGSLDGKVLVDGGSYKEHGDTIDFRDPVCNAGYTGQYHVRHYGDSIKFSVIEDSCTLRRQGTDGIGFKRLAP